MAEPQTLYSKVVADQLRSIGAWDDSYMVELEWKLNLDEIDLKELESNDAIPRR